MQEKNNPKILNAWASYDWANSVYNLSITTAIFPIYYLGVTKAAFNGEYLQFLGMTFKNDALYSYSVSFSFLVIVFLSPILSGIADYSGKKKFFMQVFTYMGAFSCIGLYFFHGENIYYGTFCFVTASMGYAGALVFYNAFLPEIATEEKFDFISARGYSMGYIGSVIMLIISLVTMMKVDLFFDVEGKTTALVAEGISAVDASKQAIEYYRTFATKLSFLSVGIWWLLFSQIAFYFLKDRKVENDGSENLMTKGFKELNKVWRKMKDMPVTKGYLMSFFFYSMGVQTIMVLAPLFGEKVLELAQENLIGTVLLLQIIAVPGAYLFAKISDVYGNKTSICIMLFLWIGVCIGAYSTYTDMQFYVLASVVGVIMGGIQSLSRSTYSKLVPQGTVDTASFFSFYDVTEKLAIVIGTFSYGLISELAGMRNTALALSVYFVIGTIILLRTPLIFKKKAE